MHLIKRITSVKVTGLYTLQLEFDDGASRIVNLEPILYGELFGPLRNTDLFAKVSLDPETSTIVWPNGADFDPFILYDWPNHLEELTRRASDWEKVK